jgi:RHS repeat-associated protein
VQTQAQAENNGLIVQSTAYDELGRPVTATVPYTVTGVGGTYLTPNWSTLAKTITRYDALGRVIQVIAQDGNTIQHAYRDWHELALDASGHQTEYERDGLGRLIATREYYGTYAALTWDTETPAETRYWYNASGSLIAVRDALSNTTRMTYDPLGRKTAMDDPSMGHWEYRYDAASNLITQTDALQQSIGFTYDRLDRVIDKRLAGALQPLATYEYDTGANGIGHRTAMTDTTGIARWQFDARGRLIQETRTPTGLSPMTIGYVYDAADRVVTLTYPNSEVVSTTFNLRGLPTQIRSQTYGVNYLASASYNALGQPLQQSWGNTRVTSYTYDPRTFRMQQIQVSGNLLDLRYGYDRVGNVAAITDTFNANQVQTFGYDARDRLTWARTNTVGNGQYTEAYGYDRMGNIITRTVNSVPQTYAYGRPPEVITNTLPRRAFLPLIVLQLPPDTMPPATFTQPFAAISTTTGFKAVYDKNGNMTQRVEVTGTQRITFTQQWDAENHLNVVTNTVTGQVTRFYYDGDGNRIKKVDPSGQATIYLGALYEKNLTTATEVSYYFAGAQRIAMRQGGVLYYLAGDHLGSTSVTVDSSGNRYGELRYTPFGDIRYEWSNTPTDRQFTGQRRENVSAMGSLYDYNARMYSPALNRFISADTFVPDFYNPQSLNRQSYVNNNPLRYVDPSGHEGCSSNNIANCTATDLLNNLSSGSILSQVGWSIGVLQYLQQLLLSSGTGNLLWSNLTDPQFGVGATFTLLFKATGEMPVADRNGTRAQATGWLVNSKAYEIWLNFDYFMQGLRDSLVSGHRTLQQHFAYTAASIGHELFHILIGDQQPDEPGAPAGGRNVGDYGSGTGVAFYIHGKIMFEIMYGNGPVNYKQWKSFAQNTNINFGQLLSPAKELTDFLQGFSSYSRNFKTPNPDVVLAALRVRFTPGR